MIALYSCAGGLYGVYKTLTLNEIEENYEYYT